MKLRIVIDSILLSIDLSLFSIVSNWTCFRSLSLPVRAVPLDARDRVQATSAHDESGRSRHARALRKSRLGYVPSQAEKYRRC
ncbi:hypothetical protein D3C80_1929700 [compost metagenome]